MVSLPFFSTTASLGPKPVKFFLSFNAIDYTHL